MRGSGPGSCGPASQEKLEGEIATAKLEGKTALLTDTSPNIVGGLAEGLAAEGRERAARWGVEWPAPRHGQRAKGLLRDASQGAPLLKLPSPRHYAAAAVFLASDDAEMITAFDLRVDAGAVSRYWLWNPGEAGA